MKRFLTIAVLILVLVVSGAAFAEDGWRLSTYDSAGTVGINFLGATGLSGKQFVLDSFQSAAISATAGATMEVFTRSGDSVIVDGANSAGATTIVATSASGGSAFWNTTMTAGELVCVETPANDPNVASFACAEFVSGSTLTGTVKGLNAAIADGATLYRYSALTGNLAFEAPTTGSPIFIFGEGQFPPIADFTVANYSFFPGGGIACRVNTPCVFQSYSGATTTSPAIYLRGHYTKYK